MPYEGDVNEGPLTVCAVRVYMRTVLDIFPETQGLLDFRGVFEGPVLYYVRLMSSNDVSDF